MNQAQLNFDRARAMAAKRAGQKRVEENNERFMEEARACAKRISIRNGDVTADDVRRECRFEPAHSNAWGSVFRPKNFMFTGEFRRSELVQGHGNLQRVWRWLPSR